MKSPKVSFRLPQKDIEAIDKLVQHRVFKRRSDFLRRATEQLLQHYAEYTDSLKGVENIE